MNWGIKPYCERCHVNIGKFCSPRVFHQPLASLVFRSPPLVFLAAIACPGGPSASSSPRSRPQGLPSDLDPKISHSAGDMSKQPARSFVAIVRNYHGASTPQIYNNPLLSKKGKIVCIKIDEELYQQRMALYKPSMICRVIQSKGETTWKIHDLLKKLEEYRQPIGI